MRRPTQADQPRAAGAAAANPGWRRGREPAVPLQAAVLSPGTTMWTNFSDTGSGLEAQIRSNSDQGTDLGKASDSKRKEKVGGLRGAEVMSHSRLSGQDCCPC